MKKENLNLNLNLKLSRARELLIVSCLDGVKCSNM